MKCPVNGGCINYIAKRFHSLVLMAFANSNDKFLYVNIGLKVAVQMEAPPAIQACSRQLRTIEADQKLTHYLEGHLYLIGDGIEIHTLRVFARKQESQLNS